MVHTMMSPPKGAPLPFPVTDSVGRHDVSFDGSENTNLFVEELLHKTESQIPVLRTNSREAHLLTTRRRLSLGATFDDAEATKRSISRHSLFPPVFPNSHKHASISSQYSAVKGLKPEDQTKEWWKMLYGDDTTHIRTIIPRSAPSKSWYVSTSCVGFLPCDATNIVCTACLLSRKKIEFRIGPPIQLQQASFPILPLVPTRHWKNPFGVSSLVRLLLPSSKRMIHRKDP